MYTPLITLALYGQAILNTFQPNAQADSIRHYNTSVGYFTENKQGAITADSLRLVKLTPSLLDYERNAMSKTQAWYLTENYEKIIKRPIQKYKSTFLNPVKQ